MVKYLEKYSLNYIYKVMPQRICERCKMVFEAKIAYDRHLKRKIPCIIRIEKFLENEDADEEQEQEPEFLEKVEKFKKLNKLNKFNKSDKFSDSSSEVYEDDSDNSDDTNSISGIDHINNINNNNEPMKKNQCCNCSKIFAKKANLMRHINQNICTRDTAIIPFTNNTNNINDIDDIDNINNIDNIDSDDNNDNNSDNDSNYTNINNSKYSKSDLLMIEQLKNELEIFKKEIKKKEDMSKQEVKNLKNEIKILKKSNKAINNNNINSNSNNTTNSNNTVNNIVLVNYGNEDMSKIDKEKLLSCITRGPYQSTVRLTDALHFDPDHPENHNVYISNIHNKYAMEYKNNQWNIVTKSELIDKIYRNKKDYIEENLNEFYESLTDKQKQSLNDWLNTDDEHRRVKKIKNDICLLLFNKRHLIGCEKEKEKEK